MAKPIPYNPNVRKVTMRPSKGAQNEVRVVVMPPAESNAESDAPKGQSLLKRIGRVRKAAPKRGNKR
jgi:hypothetical protein